MSFDGPPLQSGNREGLSFRELEILENQVLPTARRWLKINGLRDHGVSILRYWGEAAE